MKKTILKSILMMMLLFTACGQKTENEIQGTPTVTPQTTPTKAATATPIPTATCTPTPTPTPVIYDEGMAILNVMTSIDTSTYLIEGVKKYTYEEEEYFRFTMSFEGSEMQPEILVKVKGGEMFYLESGNRISEFRGFPLDNVENLVTEGEKITGNDAVTLLKNIPADKLGLKKSIDEYEIVTDSWTTMMYGAECYGVNVYDKSNGTQALAGAYYISVDGSRLFKLEIDTYIEVKLDID